MTLYCLKSLLQNYKNYDKKTNSQEVKKIDKRKSDKERDRDMISPIFLILTNQTCF